MIILDAIRTIKGICDHPLNRNRKIQAVSRWLSWQIGSAFSPGPVAVDWVGGARLLVAKGMTGATGNIYSGLLEYPEMSFILHFLRKEHVFVDIGSNAGVYSVLSSAVVGARSIALEPVPSTYRHLVDNIRLNGIDELTRAINVAVGAKQGKVQMTDAFDAMNHIVCEAEQAGQGCVTVPVDTLDNLLKDSSPSVIKIDVEGFESEVVSGGTEVLSGSSVRAMLVELNGSGARYGYCDQDIHDAILGFGFLPYSYSPDTRKLELLDGINETSPNTIYVRDKSEADELVRNAELRPVMGMRV